MALATILKSHKPVNPIFVPVEETSTTRVTKKSSQEDHQEVDCEVDEVEDEADTEDELLDQDEVQQVRSKSQTKGKNHKQTICDKTSRRKGARETTENQILVDPEKGKRTVFVGNLPPTCTKKQLVKMFCRFGKIESIRFRCARGSKLLPKRTVAKQGWANTEQSTEMIAYIVFEKEGGMMKSLEANGTLLKDRHIRVDSVEGTSQHKHSHSVFVGNLPFTITNERLREALQQCGEIEGTRVVRDKKTGCGKGFGFVLFKEKSGVMFALKQARSIEIDGRKLRIFKSSDNPQRQDKRSRKKKFQKVQIASNKGKRKEKFKRSNSRKRIGSTQRPIDRKK